MKCLHSKDGGSKLSVCALGFALGITWALGVALLGILSWKFNQYGDVFVQALSSVYIGYGSTPQGIVIGTGWALIDGFICGVIIAWLYNVCKRAFCCGQCQTTSVIEGKSLNQPDEVRNLPKTKIEVVTVGKATIMRATFEPGWKWSECVKPTVGTKSCLAPHIGYIISGKMKVVLDNGTEKEFSAGDANFISPGHDAWVVGNEPCIAIDFTAGEIYGKK